MSQLHLAKNLLILATIGLLLGVLGSVCSSLYFLINIRDAGAAGTFSISRNTAICLWSTFAALVPFTLAVGFRAYAQACVEQQFLQARAARGGPIYQRHESV